MQKSQSSEHQIFSFTLHFCASLFFYRVLVPNRFFVHHRFSQLVSSFHSVSILDWIVCTKDHIVVFVTSGLRSREKIHMPFWRLFSYPHLSSAITLFGNERDALGLTLVLHPIRACKHWRREAWTNNYIVVFLLACADKAFGIIGASGNQCKPPEPYLVC